MKRFEIINKSGKASIKITGEIGWWKTSGENFTQLVDRLLEEGVQDVEGYINTPGGSMFDANEIGNQISRFPGIKSCKLGALCASAGTTLSTYFDTVETASNTQYMIHDPSWSPFIQHLEDWESNKQLYVNLRENAIDRYVAKTGLSREVVSEMMRKTTWMNADTLLEKGFVDSISKEKDSLPDDAQNVLKNMGLEVPEVLNIAFQNQNQNKINMSKIAQSLGLPDNSTEDQIVAAIQNKGKNENADTAMDALVALGKEKGFKEEIIRNLGKADYATTLKMVQDAPAAPKAEGEGTNTPPAAQDNVRLTDLVNELRNNSGTNNRSGWTYGDWLKNDYEGLNKMQKEDPAKFDQLSNVWYSEFYKK
jgi:ATP-dependent Clp protease protease subunit